MKNIKPGSFVHAADQHGLGGEFYGILLSFGEVELRDGRVVREAHVLDLSRVDTSQGARGKPSNRSYHQQFRQKVLQLVTTHYGDFGPTFACQKLRERHGCTVSVGTLKTWMKQDGLWQERRARQKAVHQPDGATNVSVNWS